jgi:hypothetical protein
MNEDQRREIEEFYANREKLMRDYVMFPAKVVAEAERHTKTLFKEIDRLQAQLDEADHAWQASEARYLDLCQLFGIDYTCEEPETVRDVILRLQSQTEKAEAKLATQRKYIETLKADVRNEIQDKKKAEAELAKYKAAAQALFDDAIGYMQWRKKRAGLEATIVEQQKELQELRAARKGVDVWVYYNAGVDRTGINDHGKGRAGYTLLKGNPLGIKPGEICRRARIVLLPGGGE